MAGALAADAKRLPCFEHGDHALYVDMNFIPYTPRNLHGRSWTSARLLDTAFPLLAMAPEWKAVIGDIQCATGPGQTVWGLRQEAGRYSLELYFYYPKRHAAHDVQRVQALLEPYVVRPFALDVEMGNYECLSFNLASQQVDGLNIYYIDDYRVSESIQAHSWFLPAGSLQMEKRNTYHALLTESGFHEDGFHFSDASRKVEECCRRLFPGEDAALAAFYERYEWLWQGGVFNAPVGVAEKSGAAGLYFMRLSINQFIAFLREHGYPALLVDRLAVEKDNLAHMRYDIGIDFYLEGGRAVIRKTAFFGSV